MKSKSMFFQVLREKLLLTWASRARAYMVRWLVAALGTLWLASVNYAASPGSGDSTWNGGVLGRGVFTSVVDGITLHEAYAIAVQADNKVLVGGRCSRGIDRGFCVVRYGPSGLLDDSWNGTGIAFTSIGSGSASASASDFPIAYAIAIQPDDKVLLAGHCHNGTNNDFCSVRHNPNGTLDASWNGTGILITPVGSGEDRARAIALQPDGKVLLAGDCWNGYIDFCTVRYNANGTLDSSWSSDGLEITGFGFAGNNFANAIALQPDGKVLVAGHCFNGSNSEFCAIRYRPDGTLDPDWSGSGWVVTPIGSGNDVASTFALQPDGKVLLAGSCINGTKYNFCTLRYDANGTLDTSWNSTGKTVTPINTGTNEYASALALQSDGKVLLAGACVDPFWVAMGFEDFCVLRYHSNGTVDTSWGYNGSTLAPISSRHDRASAIALQPDGKVLLAGFCFDSIRSGFCSYRFHGGPFGYQNCKMDIDGDNKVLPSTDALLLARVSLGMTGASVLNGISFVPHAKRTTWPAIREYLVTQCGMQIP